MKSPANKFVRGRLDQVREDFLFLRYGVNGELKIIPFENINHIKMENKPEFPKGKMKHEKSSIIADPCLRRELVLNFGATVSNSPLLIDKFFGLSLPVFLLTVIHQNISVVMPNFEAKGILINVNSESLCIEKENQSKVIPILSICEICI